MVSNHIPVWQAYFKTENTHSTDDGWIFLMGLAHLTWRESAKYVQAISVLCDLK